MTVLTLHGKKLVKKRPPGFFQHSFLSFAIAFCSMTLLLKWILSNLSMYEQINNKKGLLRFFVLINDVESNAFFFIINSDVNRRCREENMRIYHG